MPCVDQPLVETKRLAMIASDQRPDHDVQHGEVFIAQVYNAIRENSDLWKSTAILLVHDEHGGIYNYVAPPSCPKDGFKATPNQTGVPGLTFEFDRLSVRVPAVLISLWIPKATVVPVLVSQTDEPSNTPRFPGPPPILPRRLSGTTQP